MSSMNPACMDCELWETARTVCVKGQGPENAQIIIVTEYPSPEEDRGGRPFTSGDASRVMKDELAKSKLAGEVYITNLVKCRPPRNEAPTPAQVKACRKYLDKEIETLKPKYVVTLGVPPTKALFRGKAKINSVHGELIESDKVDYIGMPTFHPAYTLRDPSKLPGFQSDIKRLSDLYYGKAKEDKVVWNVVRRGNLQQFLSEFEEAKEFAFDCETSGLFQYGGLRYITAVSIALEKRTWLIPGFMHPDFQHFSPSPWRHGRSLEFLMNLLFYMADRDKKRGYAWNGKFDNIWLMKMFGGRFRLSFDGMLASHTLNENTSNDLTSNCRTFLHVSEYDIPLYLKNGMLKPGDKVSTNWKYCAEDATYTFRLVKIFQQILKAEAPLRRLFYSLIMPAARAMENIEMRGLTVNLEKMSEEGERLRQRKYLLQKKLDKRVGKPVNWNSPAQVGEVLFDELGIIPELLTPKGKPSTSEQALLDLKGKHDVVDMLLRYREVTKFLSTYIDGFKELMIDDKLYVSYKLHGTVTGRYSSRIHSIPRDGSIRNLVEAPPGWRFVQGDISQAELRIAASVSGDEALIYCFLNNIDVHWRTLMETLRVGQVGNYAELVMTTAKKLEPSTNNYTDAIDLLLETGDKVCTELFFDWKEGRKKAKAINFGFIYGMYEKKFMETAKEKYQWEATFAEAKLARDTYFNLYNGIPRWHSKQKKLARLNGFVRCLSGRIRRLPAITSKDRSAKSEAERQAINSPIQGFIGDYKAMVMVEIEETIDHDQFRLVGEHHDAVLGEVRMGCEEEVLPKIYQIICKPKLLETLKVNLKVPMEGELEIGPWGLGKKFQV